MRVHSLEFNQIFFYIPVGFYFNYSFNNYLQLDGNPKTLKMLNLCKSVRTVLVYFSFSDFFSPSNRLIGHSVHSFHFIIFYCQVNERLNKRRFRK